VAAVKDLTNGKGAEAVVDFVGESGAEEWGVEMMRPGGFSYIVGYGGTLRVPTMKIILEELSFIGNLVGSYNELAELMTLAAQGRVHLHTREVPAGRDQHGDGRPRPRPPGARAILVP